MAPHFDSVLAHTDITLNCRCDRLELYPETLSPPLIKGGKRNPPGCPLKSVGVKNRRNAFHSFRHCFEDACRDSGISKEVMDALQGHGEEGMSGRYGRGFGLKKLAEAMGQLRYDGLDLSHLIAR